MFAGQVLTLLGDSASARLCYAEALAHLDAALSASPMDWQLRSLRGVVLGALGRRAEALAEARWMAGTDEYRNDRWVDGRLMGSRALVLVGAGANDDALREIEKALSRPSLLTVHELRLSPGYDPIRADPRFQALLVKYADPLLLKVGPQP